LPSWDSLGPKTVNAVSTNDQWHPVLDDNENGQYAVMYYDRRGDLNNISYQVYGDKIDAAGNRLEGDTLLYQAGLSNMLAYTAIFDVGHASRTLGEYQGLWYWYGTWYGATVYIPAIPGTTGDIYSVSIVSP
jgi:hypothetical protein